MAFTPQELKIAEYGKAQGKTKEQVMEAITKYRSTQTSTSVSPAQPAGQFDVPNKQREINHSAKLAQLQASVPEQVAKANAQGSIWGTIKNTVKEIGNTLSSSEQALGRSVGAIAGTGQATEQANQSVQADTQMALKFLRTISENEKAGKDATHLKQVYNQWKQGQPNGSALPELPTTGQVVGQLGGVALDVLSFGTYGKGAQGMVTGALAPKAPTIVSGLKAVASDTAGLFTKKGATAVAKGAGVGYGYDVTQGLQGNRGEDREGAKALIPGLNTVVGGAIPAVAGFAQSVKNGTPAAKSTMSKSVTGVVDTIDSVGEKIKRPDVTSATAVSLNPKKALAGTGQDVQVSVGGKLKQLSDVTPDEYSKMQMGTQRNMANFTKEAELFKNNRNPANDPTAIIWKRAEKALKFADKKRQGIGAKMGEIEVKYANNKLPVGQKVNAQFAETIKSFNNPKFGVDTQDAKVVQKLVDDFDRLEKGGATVGERMEFVRAWDKYLNDSKDAFGKFKENATANTRIQNAVLTLKNETVDAISAGDSVYRGLRKEYAVHKKLAEFADSLGGIDGMLGDSVKGGAAVKRAIKSNSDGGARQFFFKLKELTGYDTIKDADIALTAMDNVGDYQGLSLLEVLNDGKSGLIKRGLEGVRNKLVGNQTTRVNKFIQDASAKQNKISQTIPTAIPKGGQSTVSINQSNIPIHPTVPLSPEVSRILNMRK